MLEYIRTVRFPVFLLVGILSTPLAVAAPARMTNIRDALCQLTGDG